jgi:LysR family transcriptional regulator for bpeEF and oprC
VYHIVIQSNLDLGALRGFVAVAEHDSFTAAAASLGVSKVFLSRAVASLELRLGAPLLVRTTRSVRSTEAGEVVLRHARELLERADALDRAVADTARDPSGHLRIVASQVIYDLLLEPVVIPFMRRHPRVTLELDVGNELPRAAAFDLALFVGPPRDSSMGSLLIGKARLACFATAAYLDKHGTPVRPDALSAHTIIVVGRSATPLSWSFAKGSRAVSVSLKPRLSVASHDLAVRAVASGAGIARLPLFVASRSSRPLVRILSGWTIPEVPAYAIFPGRERPAPAVRVFLDLLKERLRAARASRA